MNPIPTENLIPPTSRVSSNALLAWARDWVGVPFVSKGRGREGIDCWGLVMEVYREFFNAEVPDYAGDYSCASPHSAGPVVSSEIKKPDIWVPVKERLAGSVAVFRIQRIPTHTAVTIDDRRFIHSGPGTGVTIEKFSSIIWRKRFCGCYMYAGIG